MVHKLVKLYKSCKQLFQTSKKITFFWFSRSNLCGSWNFLLTSASFLSRAADYGNQLSKDSTLFVSTLSDKFIKDFILSSAGLSYLSGVKCLRISMSTQKLSPSQKHNKAEGLITCQHLSTKLSEGFLAFLKEKSENLPLPIGEQRKKWNDPPSPRWRLWPLQNTHHKLNLAKITFQLQQQNRHITITCLSNLSSEMKSTLSKLFRLIVYFHAYENELKLILT